LEAQPRWLSARFQTSGKSHGNPSTDGLLPDNPAEVFAVRWDKLQTVRRGRKERNLNMGQKNRFFWTAPKAPSGEKTVYSQIG
jgi:hypothetical protein